MASQYFDYIVSTGRFNLSQKKDYFLSDDSFGDDFAQWLIEVLKSEGFMTSEPEQEEWGWYFTAAHKGDSYLVTVSGDSDGHEEMPNQGEWRISTHKPRTFMDKIFIRNFMSSDEKILLSIGRNLKSQPDIKIIDTESSIQ